MEKLKQIIEDFKFLTFGINEHCLEDYLSEHTIEILANHLIEKGYTKQEVAREIFEEVDNIRLNYYEGLYTEEQATEKYLEVQKKYIGE